MRISRLGLGILLALGLGATAAPGYATHGIPQNFGGSHLSENSPLSWPLNSEVVNAPFTTEAAAIASSLGQPVPITEKELRLQKLAESVGEDLSAEPSVTGFWVTRTPDWHLAIGVRSGANRTTLQSLLPSTLADNVVFVEQTYSEEELAKIAAQLRSSIGNTVADFAVSVNVPDQKVELIVANAGDAETGTQAWKHSKYSGKAADNVVVPVVDAGLIPKPAANIYAGLGATGCTSGFTVYHAQLGVRGVTTAAHCGNSQTVSGVGLTYKWEYFSGASDVQWHTASSAHTFRNFAADGVSDSTPYYRTITSTTSRLSLLLGGSYCKTGKTTGYGCGTLNSRTEYASWVPNDTQTYLAIDSSSSSFCIGGDSGGPVSRSSSAVGLVSGCTTNGRRLIGMSMDGFAGKSIAISTS